MADTLFMETTQVPAERTAGEISAVLIKAGANQIATTYEEGKITGLRWIMRVNGKDLLFAMPARVEPVYQILLRKARKSSRWWGSKEQLAEVRSKAERVAWRQLLRWTQAQLAMIDCGMSEASEVFFPYMQTDAGKTLYQLFAESEFKLLAAPEAPTQ